MSKHVYILENHRKVLEGVQKWYFNIYLYPLKTIMSVINLPMPNQLCLNTVHCTADYGTLLCENLFVFPAILGLGHNSCNCRNFIYGVVLLSNIIPYIYM